jgi:uncharacterized membrane protein YjfL (UPF0719 family)
MAPLPLIIGVVIVLWLSKLVYQRFCSYRLTCELTENDNPAVGLYLSGYLLAIGLALLGATRLEKDISWHYIEETFFHLGFGTLVAVPLMLLAGVINDRWLLYKFSVTKEIVHDRNLGTASVSCGAFIATGLILMSSFIGVRTTWQQDVVAILATYVVGQAVFLAGGFLFQKSVAYDLHYEIGERDNVSAGIMFGSFLAALGLVMSAAITGIEAQAQTDWLFWLMRQLLFAAIAGLFGIIVLLTVGMAMAKLIFWRVSLDSEVQQKNAAVALVLAAVYLIVGLVIQAFAGI